ncbi:hypothetical protein ACLB2K_014989 [Fragaria x ananassa]
MQHKRCGLSWLISATYTKYSPESRNVTRLREPGLVRYCAGFSSNHDESTIKWAKERLVMIDPTKRCLSYEVIDSNMGFKSYLATMHVVPSNDDDSSMIEWSFVCDPNKGGRMEDVQSFGESALQSIAKKIDHVLSSSNLN